MELSNNMKVAACISGHTRAWSQTWPVIQEILGSLPLGTQVDKFVHTWHNVGWPPKKDRQLTTREEENLIKTVRPTSYQFEHEEYYSDDNLHLLYYDRSFRTDHAIRHYRQMYSVYKSMRMAYTCDDYDLVIRLRFDLNFYENPLKWSAIRHVLDNDQMAIPAHVNGSYPQCKDQFAYGPAELMYSTYALHPHEKLFRLVREGALFTMESLIGRELDNKGKEVYPYKMNYTLLRKGGKEKHLPARTKEPTVRWIVPYKYLPALKRKKRFGAWDEVQVILDDKPKDDEQLYTLQFFRENNIRREFRVTTRPTGNRPFDIQRYL